MIIVYLSFLPPYVDTHFCLVLTIPEEVDIVWLGRPSFVKALFLFNRYVCPLFVAIDIVTLSSVIHLTDKVRYDTYKASNPVSPTITVVSETL